ncbi:MAG: NAD(P)/FAD-dependent oxidoreductase [Synergistaceae bacterium]|jgi:sarcosine oxidase subunit alpha|nr:NAD(P)/FAD-dependent oxidoreductase [Synergistaceae bacterium]
MANKCEYGVAVIGGGPAGLAAAIAAKELLPSPEGVLLIERDRVAGGILNQCIHDGFGLHRFGEALSGPEYASRFIDKADLLGVPMMLNTIVLGVSDKGEYKELLVSSRQGGLSVVRARAVVLAMGCRERPRGALSIPGHRPSGVYTAGAAQNLINLENIMPGRDVVILGSGDIGMIMARRMTLEGAKVEAVFELLPWASGLPRNIQQCLVDYGIPLYLGTTVVNILGMGRLEGVTVAEVGPDRKPKRGTERFVPCDTLLLSVGLIPENELARAAGVEMNPITGGPVVDADCMTSVSGVFSCGNALHVHDLVDFVSEEAERAGRAAAEYLSKPSQQGTSTPSVAVRPAAGVRYTVPNRIALPSSPASPPASVAFRVNTPSRAGTVRLKVKDKVLAEETHARLHPAEMVWMKLGPDALASLSDADTIEVSANGSE